MKCLSLFSGIGGFDLALQRCGHETVGACEIDQYARRTFARHFPGVMLYGDITRQLDTQNLPDFDLICAGFPCQAFSIAGKRLGFEDTRGTLFYEIVRIAREKQTKTLLLENVKGLLNHDGGRTFRTIISALDELGYDVEWQVLNSKYFVPQNRERVYIIGHLRGTGGRKIFPIGDFSSEFATQELKQIGNIDTKGHNSLWGRVYDIEGISSNLNAEGGGLGAKTGLYAIVNDKGKFREVKTTTALDAHYGNGCDNHAQRTMVYMSQKNSNMKQREQERLISWTLTNNGGDFGLKEGVRIRRLTPKECERLQGFPDNWTAGNSDTQRYKQIGNAVTVPVIEYLLRALYD